MSITCCYCGANAVGRYCFLNKREDVVDNPFCSFHLGTIYEQTRQSLETMHRPGQIAYDFILSQRWDKEAAPDLPVDKIDLLQRGAVYVR